MVRVPDVLDQLDDEEQAPSADCVTCQHCGVRAALDPPDRKWFTLTKSPVYYRPGASFVAETHNEREAGK